MKKKLKRTIAALSAIAMLSTTATVLPEKLPVGVGITANAENSEIVESNSWLEVSCAENNYKTIDYTSSDENTYTCYVYSSTEYSAVLISVNGWSYNHHNGVLGYDNQVADLASKGARMPKFAELQILLDAGMNLKITDNFNCQEYEVAWVENGKWRGQKGNNKYADSAYHAVFEINRNPIETVSDSIFKTDSSPTLSAVKGEDFTWQGNCDIEISYYNSDKTICDSAPTAAGNYYVKVSTPTIEADEDGNTVRYEASESDYIPFTIVHNFPDTFDSNGFGNCQKCNAAVYQPATETTDKYDIDDDGTKDIVYEISNAGQLYWFAGLVNGTLDGVEQNTLANAILTANITVNENLLDSLQYDEEGNVSNGSDFITWTPIADWMGNRTTQYSGTFDGNNKTVSGLYFNGDSTCIGLFGSSESDGNIKNVGVVDSYFKGNDSVGGVCGNNAGTITNCYNAGNLTAIESSATIGGICGYNNGGTIANCYNTGTVTATGSIASVGGVCGCSIAPISNCYNIGTVTATSSGADISGICGYNFGPVTNCYYLADTEDENGGKTAEQFKSGEVAYLLNGRKSEGDMVHFYQNLSGENADALPVLDKSHGVVYGVKDCTAAEGAAADSYTNNKNAATIHDFDKNGFCTKDSTHYQPATLNETTGNYEISNVGQLYWFADKVSNDNATYGSANAVLTADISANVGDVSGCDGTKADGWRDWTPIGNFDNEYSGTFDGQNHTISGLYFNDSSINYVGLFGVSYGTIQNIGIENSYFKGGNYVSGVCGSIGDYNETAGKIINCYNTGTISGTSHVGGVCGYNIGTIQNSYNTGTVSATEDYVGGVCGDNYIDADDSGNNGIVKNSYYLDTCAAEGTTFTNDDGISKTADQFTNGEVAYLLNFHQTIGKDEIPTLNEQAKAVVRLTLTYDETFGDDADTKELYYNAADKVMLEKSTDKAYTYRYFDGETELTEDIYLMTVDAVLTVKKEAVKITVPADVDKLELTYKKAMTEVDLNSYVENAADLGELTFKVDDASQLPEGLELFADGTLSGTPAKAADSVKTTVIVTAKNGETAKIKLTFQIAKADSTVEVTVDGDSHTEGDLVSELKLILSGNNTKGLAKIISEIKALTAGENTLTWEFTPEDENYNVVTGTVVVNAQTTTTTTTTTTTSGTTSATKATTITTSGTTSATKATTTTTSGTTSATKATTISTSGTTSATKATTITTSGTTSATKATTITTSGTTSATKATTITTSGTTSATKATTTTTSGTTSATKATTTTTSGTTSATKATTITTSGTTSVTKATTTITSGTTSVTKATTTTTSGTTSVTKATTTTTSGTTSATKATTTTTSGTTSATKTTTITTSGTTSATNATTTTTSGTTATTKATTTTTSGTTSATKATTITTSGTTSATKATTITTSGTTSATKATTTTTSGTTSATKATTTTTSGTTSATKATTITTSGTTSATKATTTTTSGTTATTKATTTTTSGTTSATKATTTTTSGTTSATKATTATSGTTATTKATATTNETTATTRATATTNETTATTKATATTNETTATTEETTTKNETTATTEETTTTNETTATTEKTTTKNETTATTEETTTTNETTATTEETTTTSETTAATGETTTNETTVATKATTATSGTTATTSATQTTTITSASSTESTAATSANTITTAATTSMTNIADEDLCSWAINDYQKKAGIVPANAEITARSEEACKITLTDENGNVLDVYTVDPKTGTGTDSSNAEVNLPQTGNNSMTNWLLCVGAAMFMALGFGAVKASGILKRKEDE